MAQRYFGLNRGENRTNIVTGSSTTATLDIEIRIDDAAGLQKGEAQQLISYLEEFILQTTGAPTV